VVKLLSCRHLGRQTSEAGFANGRGEVKPQGELVRILAIETIGQSGSVAAQEGEKLLSTVELDPSLRSAQSLAPAIVQLLERVSWRPAEVQMVAVATGPGSFTGLRVGVTTAKMFAYAVGGEVMGVNTLEAIAWQTPPDAKSIWCVLDALRNQLFAAQFVRDEWGVWQTQVATSLIDDQAWLTQLVPGQFVSGPGLSKLQAIIPTGVRTVDQKQWSPKAASIGALAWRQYQASRRDDLRTMVPQYYRLSAAEEKRAEKPALNS
jgi:tRNA threonylcarbamoyladenosine biosynthesis protein TsaB